MNRPAAAAARSPGGFVGASRRRASRSRSERPARPSRSASPKPSAPVPPTMQTGADTARESMCRLALARVWGLRSNRGSRRRTSSTSTAGCSPTWAARSGSPCSRPRAMIAMMERTAAMLVLPAAGDGKATVGFEVCVKHVAAARGGVRCTAHARLEEIVDGRKLRFAVEVICRRRPDDRRRNARASDSRRRAWLGPQGEAACEFWPPAPAPCSCRGHRERIRHQCGPCAAAGHVRRR